MKTTINIAISVIILVILAGCVTQKEAEISNECKNIGDQQVRDSCNVGLVKAQTLSYLKCVGENKTRQDCLDEKKSQYTTMCSQIANAENRDLCYNTLVFMYQDEAICKKIGEQSKKNDCFLYKLQLYGDCKYKNTHCALSPTELNGNYCDNFLDDKSRFLCEAILSEDYNKCLQINASYTRTQCLTLFDKQENIFAYEKNGRKYTVEADLELKPFMESIKELIPINATVTSWWDYGHMIRGISNKEAVIYTPSEEIMKFVASSLQTYEYFPPPVIQTLFSGRNVELTFKEKHDYNTKKYGELSKNEDIKNVALILTTTNPQEAINLMKKYNSEYLLVTYKDLGLTYVLYNISGIPAENFNPDKVHNGVNVVYYLNKNSIFYRMLQSEQIEGFESFYANPYLVIYKIK